MATTTTNFNFPIPQSTDLVKDGATAIAALGTSVDTQFVDLKGGTTGQVLAKASNTDLDYSWVTTDDANAIQNSIVDAKGDLIGATANDTPARLAVGTNGQVLTADSTASTGLVWATPSAGYSNNGVLNSAFQVWQRGTSFTASSATTGYTADRWLGYRSVAGGTISRQATGDTTNLPNIQYCARIARDSGNTSTATINFYNTFESINSIPFAGQTVTLSFYARKGANYSSTTTNVLLTTGTGTDQNILSGFTGQSNVISSTVTPTTTWARYTYTATLGATTTQVSIGIIQNPLGTAGAADYLEITGVMLETGSTASAFHTNQPTYATELAACQRYYWRATGATVGWLIGTSSTAFEGSFQMPVTFRSSASSIEWSSMRLSDGTTATNATAITLNAGNTTATNTYVTGTVASGLTQYRPYILNAANSSAYIGFSGEL